MTTYSATGSGGGVGSGQGFPAWSSPDIGSLSCDITGSVLLLGGSANGFEPPHYLILTGGPPIWSADFTNGASNQPNAVVSLNATDPTHPYLFFQNQGSRNGVTMLLYNPSGRGFPDGAALAPGCWSTAYPDGFLHFIDDDDD